MKAENIAMVAHQVNKAYCESLGDYSQPEWKDAPDWQKKSSLDGVHFHQADPFAEPSKSHENWMEEKRNAGWKYGPIKDPEKKEHPCFVDYNELPQEQKSKDYIFKAIVNTLTDYLE